MPGEICEISPESSGDGGLCELRAKYPDPADRDKLVAEAIRLALKQAELGKTTAFVKLAKFVADEHHRDRTHAERARRLEQKNQRQQAPVPAPAQQQPPTTNVFLMTELPAGSLEEQKRELAARIIGAGPVSRDG